MALEHDMTFRGLSVDAAYRRISYVGISVKNKTVVVELESYATKTNADGPNGLAFDVDSIVVRNLPEKKDVDGNVTEAAVPAFDDFIESASAGKDPVALAYGALKAMPSFKDAKDV